jgi:ribosomal protein L5
MYYNKGILLEKFNFKNIYKSPSLESISLTFNISEKTKIILGSSALFLLTGKKPVLISNELSKKNKKKEFIGCTVKLRKKEAFSFLLYFILVVLPNNELLQQTINKLKINGSSISFVVQDLLIFPELSKEVNRFYDLSPIQITLNFNKSSFIKSFLSLINLKVA